MSAIRYRCSSFVLLQLLRIFFFGFYCPFHLTWSKFSTDILFTSYFYFHAHQLFISNTRFVVFCSVMSHILIVIENWRVMQLYPHVPYGLAHTYTHLVRVQTFWLLSSRGLRVSLAFVTHAAQSKLTNERSPTFHLVPRPPGDTTMCYGRRQWTI